MMLDKKYRTLFKKNFVNTPLRKAHFMAQIHHESNLKPIEENLNYSAERLMVVFGKYFKDIKIAKQYEYQPKKIASLVYANRMGNSSYTSSDGWTYRGRGFIQITGKSNYTKLSKATNIDYLSNPDLLLNEADSMISALWYWRYINGNYYADKDDIKTITKRINGGYNGLEHRKKLLQEYKDIV